MTKINSIINSFKGDLFKKSSFVAFSSAVGALSRFLLVTVLARYLSPESYGVWVSITSIAAIMMFGDLGITNALRNKLSHLIGEGPNTTDEQREYFYTAFYFFLGLSLLICSLFLAAVWAGLLPIEKLFNTTDQHLKDQGTQIFIFIQIVFLIGIPFSLANGLFYTYDESKIAAIVNIINSIGSFLAVVVLALFLKVEMVLMARIYFLLNFLFGVVSLFWFVIRRKWYRNMMIDMSQFFSRVRELLKTGVQFLGIQLSTSFILNIPTVYLAAMAELQIAAIYNIVQKLYVFIVTIYQSAFNPVWGKMALMASMNQWHELQLLRNKIILMSLAVIGLAIMGFSMFSSFIITLVVGDQYKIPVMLVLTIGLSFLFYIIFEATAVFQSAINKIMIRLISQISVVLISGLLFSYFINNYGFQSVPLVLACIWLILFLTLYVESNQFIRKRLKHAKSNL